MKIPKYARYEYCIEKACEFLEEFNITTFPIEPEAIILNKKWGLVKYSVLMKEFQCDRSMVILFLGSNDGYTVWDESNYTISYNDDSSLGERIRFTLMHEIGHIYLNHLVDFEATQIYRGSLTKAGNKVLENEANAFARNVLVPTYMLQQLKERNVSNIAFHFGITLSAAKTRLDLFNDDLSLNRNQNLLSRLCSIFYKFYNKKLCSICGYHTISKTIKYCPICGSKSLKWGDEKMKYLTYPTDLDGRLLQCIKCGNEELFDNYCHICGSPRFNRCSNNLSNENYDSCQYSKVLPSNARYCPMCGSKSTFYTSDMLKSWHEDLNQINSNRINTAITHDIFDEIDEELPFR